MRGQRAVIFLGDGMADEPIERLGNRTPLECARTPAMDAIAREGRSGTLLTLPEGYPTGSEVANMSVLGCDLATEYCGRGPIEAAGRGIALKPGDIAFRLNLTTVRDGVLLDYSGGHIAQADAAELVAALNGRFAGETVRIHAGVGFRCILVLSGPEFSADVSTAKPDDHHGDRVEDWLPAATAPGGAATAAFLARLMREAGPLLEAHPVNRRLAAEGRPMANGVWPVGGGEARPARTLAEKYGITGAVISAVDVIVGIGRRIGMDAIAVPGATGYIDTNYEGKARAAIEALRTHDLVYVHVEAIDEVSHEQNLDLKIRTIEDFDSRIVAPVSRAAGPDVALAVLPDHPVPIHSGKHTRTPVPVAVRKPGLAPDGVRTFSEAAARGGALGAMRNGDLMRLLFG